LSREIFQRSRCWQRAARRSATDAFGSRRSTQALNLSASTNARGRFTEATLTWTGSSAFLSSKAAIAFSNSWASILQDDLLACKDREIFGPSAAGARAAESHSMQYRSLGRTGFQVSTVSFGAWAIGGTWGNVDDAESLRALHAALD